MSLQQGFRISEFRQYLLVCHGCIRSALVAGLIGSAGLLIKRRNSA
jgi:hypothetical protein